MVTYPRSSSRSGTLVAATWLIGLGATFLVQQAMGIPWSQAWPLFIVLVGAAGLISVFFEGQQPRARFAALAWPVTILAVGIVLLLSTTGRIGTEPGDLIARWWPAALIVLGGWLLLAAAIPGPSAETEQQLSTPLAGATEASVRIKFGGGELSVGHGPDEMLVSGEFRGGVVRRSLAPGRVELEQEEWHWPWGRDEWPRWRVGLTGAVPMDLQVEGGASKTVLDLRELRIRNLAIKTGASETRVTLPQAAGITTVRSESGAAAVFFDVPAGVAARIRTKMGLGGSDIDTARFPRVGDIWESPDFETAINRVEIEAQGGLGSVTVRGI
jgi:hypothetical protein